MNREDIIRLAGHRQVSEWVIKLVGDAVAAEREECAKVCEQYVNDRHSNMADVCVDAIRARGQ